jgi:molybdopterin-containing oxidoreductase family iron-sulfur binding subunit
MVRRLGAGGHGEGIDRRSFMKLLGASMALAGANGCTGRPAEHILPYVNAPELTPGVPQYYATSMTLDGFAIGLLAESHAGRPTKVEGNPDHPASLGAAGVHEQASVLQLYDPHRATRVRRGGAPAGWDELAAAFAPGALRTRVGERGAGLLIALEPSASPLEAELLNRVRTIYPDCLVTAYSPLTRGADALVPHYDLRDADIIVSAAGDILAEGPFHLRYARQFASRRRPEANVPMNRLYAMESSVSVTGSMADHRLPLRADEIESALELLLGAIDGRGIASDARGDRDRWLFAVADDLRAHPGRSLVVGSPHLSARARSLVLAINMALGNVGRTMWFTESPLAAAGQPLSLAAFADALNSAEIDTFVCLGANPAYAAPAAAGFAEAIRRIPQTVYLGLYENETAAVCHWMVPAAHYLETWGDARAYDGTLSIVQPLIEPLWGGRTNVELLALLTGVRNARPYDVLRDVWRARAMTGAGVDFETGWHRALARGFVEDSAFPRAAAPRVEPHGVRSLPASEMEIVFRDDARVRDGRFANNVWLQELPDPVTTLTWGNAAQMSPATAARLGVETDELVTVRTSAGTVHMPALLVPGHADQSVTVHFGYGRDGAEEVARGIGVDVYAIWPGQALNVAGTVTPAGGARYRLAITQPHHVMQAAEPARQLTLEEYNEPSGRGHEAPHLHLYQPPHPQGRAPQQWAMNVDLSACIGCGACVVACQAENNIPAVGREEVLRGREMHWLRIDWYRRGEARDVQRVSQPMLCQHCERAPCEYVCPVEATVHSSDGLNEMIYNRCVGTRFCSNNCPYKVRRFNWFDYNADLEPVEVLGKNPDVTVRERGVMEKCTFCVQRIRQSEIAAGLDERSIRGGEVRTACQQACPTRAIVFGSLTDESSELVRERTSRRTYAALAELGTEPRVLYLARVRNPNPVLGDGS